MSTVSPGCIARLARRLAPLGVHLLDAPVSGSVALAEGGQLTAMVGGSTEDLQRVRHVLESMASCIIHVGPLGTGSAMKLAVNAIVFGLNQALSEALVLAESAGIDRQVAYDVFASSAAAAPYVHYRRQSFLQPGEVPVAFSMELARKDLDLIEAFAFQVNAPIPNAKLNRQIVVEALNQGRGNDDVSGIAEYLRAVRRAPLDLAWRARPTRFCCACLCSRLWSGVGRHPFHCSRSERRAGVFAGWACGTR
jgi:3-hydroxyisobutyrate dehydrogenase-like beta-hydroxyacid dehydrogenase